MNWAPHVTVAAVVEHQERFLLVEERIQGITVYNQPAGHLESGESLVDAVIRETLEETGRRLTPEALVGIYRWPHPANANKTFLRYAFCGIVGDQDPQRPLDQPIVDTHWLSRAELVDTQLTLRSPMVLRCIDDYLAGLRYPLDILVDCP